MSLDYVNSKKIRKSFGKIPIIASLPNLIEVQKRSYDNFLQFIFLFNYFRKLDVLS